MDVSYLDMRGKVCLVTGATQGIGEAAARQLARLDATVVLVGPDPEKGARLSEEIQQTSDSPAGFLLADLSSQQDIRRIAEEFKNRYTRLDVLVNNAGALFPSRRQSADGIEMTFALNHLSYFLLTNLLLDLLAASAPARIINVTSAISNYAELNLQDPEYRRGYDGLMAYGQSKLANLLFTYELARRLWGSGVTVNALHPGYLGPQQGQKPGGLLAALLSRLGLGGITPEEAARSITYLAAAQNVSGISGRYFDKGKMSAAQVPYDPDTARRLWEISAWMVEEKEKPT